MHIFSTKNLSVAMLFTALYSTCSEQASSLPVAKVSVNPAYWDLLEWVNDYDTEQMKKQFGDYLGKRKDRNLVLQTQIQEEKSYDQTLEDSVKNKKNEPPPMQLLYYGPIPYYFVLNMPETITLKSPLLQLTQYRLKLFSTTTLNPTTIEEITLRLKECTAKFTYHDEKSGKTKIFNDKLELVTLWNH